MTGELKASTLANVCPNMIPGEDLPGRKDPWMHRTDMMHCHTCMWFLSKGTGRLGRCRRHAPTMSGYPAVYRNDWCGDHKLDENKI